jgi:hypothetical protein
MFKATICQILVMLEKTESRATTAVVVPLFIEYQPELLQYVSHTKKSSARSPCFFSYVAMRCRIADY